MVDKKQIMRLLKKYFETYGVITIDDKGLVSCTGNVELKQQLKHEKLPVAFDRVSGYFWCWGNQLTTLEGAPKSVSGSFSCSGNQLTSLEHAPKSVYGDVHCFHNQLTTLEGGPKSVGGNFWCNSNQLTTLEGAPTSVGGDFFCSNNQLTTLAHAPKSVVGDFDCSDNQLTTLEGAPQSVVGSFTCINNKLTTLEGMPARLGTLRLSYRRKLPLLRCLLAQKVEFVPRQRNKTVETILNKYAGQGKRAMFDCQKELEDAGLEGNAHW